MPRDVGAQSQRVEHFVGDDPRGDLTAISLDNSVNRAVKDITRGLLVHSPQIIIGPTISETLVPDQMRTDYQHSLSVRKRNDPVAIVEVETGLGRRAQPVPQEVVLGK